MSLKFCLSFIFCILILESTGIPTKTVCNNSSEGKVCCVFTPFLTKPLKCYLEEPNLMDTLALMAEEDQDYTPLEASTLGVWNGIIYPELIVPEYKPIFYFHPNEVHFPVSIETFADWSKVTENDVINPMYTLKVNDLGTTFNGSHPLYVNMRYYKDELWIQYIMFFGAQSCGTRFVSKVNMHGGSNTFDESVCPHVSKKKLDLICIDCSSWRCRTCNNCTQS
jgi:hypothetical protein